MTSPNAPIALFVFNRPEHTRCTLLALAGNPEFAHSPLHIFCDGPRYPDEQASVDAVLQVVKSFDHPDMTIHEAPSNKGLACSMLEGVSAVLNRFERVIVLEDDLTVSPAFLSFMNRCLDVYAESSNVYQISGYMFPVTPDLGNEPVFLPFPSTWGWATWKRAWKDFQPDSSSAGPIWKDKNLRKRFDLGGSYPYSKMLKNQADGVIDSWGIMWYLFIFMRQGLVVFPPFSFVKNTGFDGSGRHRGVGFEKGVQLSDRFITVPFRSAQIDEGALETVRCYLAKEHGVPSRIRRKLKGMISRVGGG